MQQQNQKAGPSGQPVRVFPPTARAGLERENSYSEQNNQNTRNSGQQPQSFGRRPQVGGPNSSNSQSGSFIFNFFFLLFFLIFLIFWFFRFLIFLGPNSYSRESAGSVGRAVVSRPSQQPVERASLARVGTGQERPSGTVMNKQPIPGRFVVRDEEKPNVLSFFIFFLLF